MSICPKCGYEGEFNACPKCGTEANGTIDYEESKNKTSADGVQSEEDIKDNDNKSVTTDENSAEKLNSLESETNEREINEENVIGEKCDSENNTDETPKNKGLSRKTIVIIVAVIAAILIGIVVGKLVNIHMHHAYLEKQYQGELTEASIGNVKISIPKDVEVIVSNSDSIKVAFKEGNQKIGTLLFTYEEEYNGSDFESFLGKEFPGIENGYSAEELSGSGYKGMIYTRERTEDIPDDLAGADSYYDIIELFKADESIFTLQYIMDPTYYREDNIATIHNNIPLEKYHTPVIKFISPEYRGKTVAETPIAEGKISGLIVNATYQDGSKANIVDKCTIKGPSVLTPGKDSKIDISVKDWNGQEHTNSLTIKCTSKVKKVDAEYTGSKKGGTKIDEDSDGLKVTAELDDGSKVTATYYSIDGPAKLEGGTTNKYKVTYGGVTDDLEIKAQKSFGQVSDEIVPEIKKADIVTLPWFTSNQVEAEANSEPSDDFPEDGWVTIHTWFDRDVYNYVSLAETGSKVGVTYEQVLLKMSGYCDEIHDKYTDEGLDVKVYFYVWQPGNMPKSGTPCYSLVSNEGIESNPFAE